MAAPATEKIDVEVALDRRVGRYDAAARDDGHVPAAWDIREDYGDMVASTHCERCGLDAIVRVGPDREWQAGRMRLGPCEVEA